MMACWHFCQRLRAHIAFVYTALARGFSPASAARGRSIAFDVLGASSLGLLQDPKNAASLTHLKGTQAQVGLILERINAISTENDYEKAFEAKFVKASEAVNMDVAAFKTLQILLITGVAAFQIQNLARFLHRNKFLECCLPIAMRVKPVV
ncbi:unnamed protein product [Effrenium voratum]|nr:unnamed protein product [Effrenium voratum]